MPSIDDITKEEGLEFLLVQARIKVLKITGKPQEYNRGLYDAMVRVQYQHEQNLMQRYIDA